MRLKSILTVAALGLATCLPLAASASAANPVDKTDFVTIAQPIPTDSGNKVEVLEFFSFSCPFCNAMEPYLVSWAKSRGDSIVLKRVPALIHGGDDVWQKAFYALDVMGKEAELHDKIFHAIHIEHKHLADEATIADFIAAQGVDRAKFLSTLNSFSVQARAAHANQLMQEYKIESTPTLAVDGRYETSPAMAQPSIGFNHPPGDYSVASLKVADWLVAKRLAEHAGAKK
ncbi:MAG: thiol:disulfide interchange protein DsbA/DsbL [Burkholderiaceae bacterium]|nr:thiol:disulfide interchange protein DsbA/DsbL [Burkholderiaceae bacterium]